MAEDLRPAVSVELMTRRWLTLSTVTERQAAPLFLHCFPVERSLCDFVEPVVDHLEIDAIQVNCQNVVVVRCYESFCRYRSLNPATGVLSPNCSQANPPQVTIQ